MNRSDCEPMSPHIAASIFYIDGQQPTRSSRSNGVPGTSGYAKTGLSPRLAPSIAAAPRGGILWPEAACPNLPSIHSLAKGKRCPIGSDAAQQKLAISHRNLYSIVTSFGVLGGSIPAGWLIIGVLLLSIAFRFLSALILEGTAMKKNSKFSCRKAKNIKNPNLNSVTNVTRLISVSFETVWALIVGWSAGATGPAPFAR